MAKGPVLKYYPLNIFRKLRIIEIKHRLFRPQVPGKCFATDLKLFKFDPTKKKKVLPEMYYHAGV